MADFEKSKIIIDNHMILKIVYLKQSRFTIKFKEDTDFDPFMNLYLQKLLSGLIDILIITIV